MTDSANYLTELHRLLNEYFSLAEIRTICSNLHIDYESVPGEEKQSRVRELLLDLGRRDLLPNIIPLLQQERPLVDWPLVPDDFQLPESLIGETAVPANQYHIYGDMVQGDKVDGDKTAIGNVSDGSVVAIGTGAVAVGPRGIYVTGDVYGNIHTGDVINYYITGAQTYFPQFTAAIENFFLHYLGTEKKPVPFGGRDQALAQLGNWLAQESTQRLLLIAPAGRGKSALLARWSRQLTTVENLAVVFMPISLRFNTNREDNTFVILATRLAHFYGKQIPINYANQSPQMWRGLVAEYLQEPLPEGRQLLLILDGLDEAAWDVAADLLPLNLPSTTRVVVSARYLGGEEQNPEPWLRRLGWDRFSEFAKTVELENLSRQGVRDVLERADLNELGLDDEVVAKLHEVSEGDPLLLELYIKELWQKGKGIAWLMLEDLQSIQPGYKGYFKKWWEDQERLWGKDVPLEKVLVNDLLEVLAMALAPMTIDDLRQVLPGQVRSSALKRAIRPLNRFVIGNGKEHGFVFSHSRLGEYFRDELEEDERAAWQTRFLTWGKRILDDLQREKINPYDVSQYLMLHYNRHLEESSTDIGTMLQLVSWEWMQVWYKKTGMYTGFLQEADRVWARLSVANETAVKQEQEAPYIGQEVLCALCYASINSLADNIPDELLASLLQYGLFTEEQVIAYLRQRTDIKKRCEAFILVMSEISDEKRDAVWREQLIEAQMIQDERKRAAILLDIAPYLPQETLSVARKMDETTLFRILEAIASYLPEETLAAVREINDENRRANLLVTVASHLPKNAIEEMLEIAKGIEHRTQLFLDIVPYLPEKWRREILEAALEAAQETRDMEWRTYLLVAVAPHLPIERRMEVWEVALASAREIHDEKSRADLLVSIAPHLSEEMRKIVLLEVLTAVREMEDNGLSDRMVDVLEKVVPYLPQETLTLALEILDEWPLTVVLSAIATYLPDETIEAAREIKDKRHRAHLLSAIAPHRPEKVLASIQGIRDEQSLSWILVAVAPYLPQEALVAACELLSEDLFRAKVLVAIASYLPDEILMAARDMKHQRAEVLVAVVPYLPSERRVRVLKEALVAAQQIGRGWQAEVLVGVTPYLPEESLVEAREIKDEEYRAKVLAGIAPYMPPEKRKVVKAEALATAREIHDEKIQAQVIRAIAPNLGSKVMKIVEEMGAWVIINENRGGRLAQAMSSVALHLPTKMQKAILAKALVIARGMESGTDYLGIKVKVLAAAAPQLPTEALDTAQEIEDERYRVEALAAIVSHLSKEGYVDKWEETFIAVRKLDSLPLEC